MTEKEIIKETWRLRKMKEKELSEMILQDNYAHTAILKRVVQEKIAFRKNLFANPKTKKLWNDFAEVIEPCKKGTVCEASEVDYPFERVYKAGELF